jgi:hypothetical protein
LYDLSREGNLSWLHVDLASSTANFNDPYRAGYAVKIIMPAISDKLRWGDSSEEMTYE